MIGRRLLRVLLFLAPVGMAGCFAGYDSRWGQQKQAQQHAARRSTPQQLPRQSSEATHVAHRVLTLRVYASPGYAASIVDWQKQFGALVEQVNAVLGPEFGAELEVSEVRSFPTQASGEKLEGPLRDLAALDPASDVDWVVGLIAATPRFAVSADDLGVALMPGRHIVMRAMSDAHECEAIERAFSELSDEERHKMYRVRKQHKLAVTFLHELAHTLGVPHELLATSLMNARYHVQAGDFSDEAADIMRASLASRVSPQSPVLDPALATKLDVSLRAAGSGWEPKAREEMLLVTTRFLGQSAPATAPLPAPKSPAPSAATVTALVEGLDPAEQRSFEAARAELVAGHAAQARQLAAPLFTKHATLPAVQSLRCDTAMAIGGDWEAISAECPGLSPFGGNR